MKTLSYGFALAAILTSIAVAGCGTDTSPAVGHQVSNDRGSSASTLKSGSGAGTTSGNQTVEQCLSLAYDLGTNPDDCIHTQTQSGDQTVLVRATPTPGPGANPTPAPASGATMRGLLQLAPDKVAGKDVWEFTVPAGSGAKPWNSSSTVFELKIGEVFRMKAAEAGHGFHVDGGSGPCRHGGNRQYNVAGQLLTFSSTAEIPVGGWFECDVGAAVDTSGATNSVYDHVKSTGARIFMRTIP